jgi:hypothetical protein
MRHSRRRSQAAIFGVSFLSFQRAVPEVSVTRRFIHVRFTTFGVMGIWRGGSAGEVDKE